MQHIWHKELTVVEVIGQGGFGVVYRASHAQFGSVVYKELDAKKLRDQYATLFKFKCNCITNQFNLVHVKLEC